MAPSDSRRRHLLLIALAWLTGSACGESEPLIRQFEASESQVPKGGAVTLSWRVEGADRVELRLPTGAVGVAPNGQQEVENLVTPRQFRLEAWSGERSDLRSLSVGVRDRQAPSIETFSVEPFEGEPGATLTVRWRTLRAQQVSLMEPGGLRPDLDVLGRTLVTVPPDASEKVLLTLVAQGPGGGEAREERTVPVRSLDAPRILRFDVSPGRVRSGEAARLSWQVEDADTVELRTRDALVRGDLSLEGSQDVLPESSTAYTLLARRTGSLETAEATVELQVEPLRLQILSFGPVQPRFAEGEPVELRWEVTSYDEVRLTDAEGVPLPIEAPGRARIQQASLSEVYTLRVERGPNGGTTATATAIAYVDPPPLAAELIIGPPVATSGPTHLSWRTEHAVYAQLLINGRPAPGFPIFDGQSVAEPVESGQLSLFGLQGASISLDVENAAGRSTLTKRLLAPRLTVTQTTEVSLNLAAFEEEAWVAIEVPPDHTLQADFRHVQINNFFFFDAFALPAADDLALFDALGQLVAEDSNFGFLEDPRLHGDLQPALRRLTSGNYYLRLRRQNASEPETVSLRIQLLPSEACGNTILDPGEACDPGPVDTPECQTCAFSGLDEPAPGAPALRISSNRTVIRGELSASIGGVSDEDTYTVDVRNGEDLRVRATIESYLYCPDTPLTLEVWDATGTERLAQASQEAPPYQLDGKPRAVTDRTAFAAAVPNDGCVGVGPGPGTDDGFLRLMGAPSGSSFAFGNYALRDFPQATSRLEDMAAGRYTLRIRATDPLQANLRYFLHVEKRPAVCGNGIREARAGEECDLNIPNVLLPPEIFGCEVCRWTGPTLIIDGPQTLTSTHSPIRLDVRSPSIGIRVELDASSVPAGTEGRPIVDIYRSQELASLSYEGPPVSGNGSPAPLTPGLHLLGWGLLQSTAFFPAPPRFFPSRARIHTYALGVCGNGVLEPGRGESCDDGNVINGDGCSAATCERGDLLTLALSSPRVPSLSIPPGGDRVLAFDIPTGRTGRFERIETTDVGTSNPCTSGELAYAYILPEPKYGALAPLIPSPAPCLRGTVELTSNSFLRNWFVNPARALKPGRHLIRLENRGTESRTLQVDLTIALSTCGDGTLDGVAGEECDDGNQSDGDRCPSNCRLPEANPEAGQEPNDDLSQAVDLGRSGPLGEGGLIGVSQVRIKGHTDGFRLSAREVDDPVDVYRFEVPAAGGPLDFGVEVYSGIPGACETWGEAFLNRNSSYDAPGIRLRLLDDAGRLASWRLVSDCGTHTFRGLEPGTWYLEVRSASQPWTYQLGLTLERP